GLEGIPIHNIEAACASSSAAFHLGVNQLRAGAADVVLAVGAEKMYSHDKAKMFSVFESAWDLETVEENANQLVEMGKSVAPPPGSQSDKPYSRFMDVYAALGRGLMTHYGITQRQLAAVAAKNHGHSVHNERAQYRKPMSVEEILAAPPITYPLTLPMCSPISDGAAAPAAGVLGPKSALNRSGSAGRGEVRGMAWVRRGASARAADDSENSASRHAGRAAFEQAGIDPREVNVAEVHDATAIGELM